MGSQGIINKTRTLIIDTLVGSSEKTETTIFRAGQLVESGDALVDRVYDTIRTHRSVLLTGPRGCGKSYCAKKGIEKALEEKKIGGFRFLQGNREIPRDLLSEDMLVLQRDDDGKSIPVLQPALAIQHIKSKESDRTFLESYYLNVCPEKQEEIKKIIGKRKEFPEYPAIPEGDGVMSDIDAMEYWTEDEWMVLYLDEINRFSDGFLDSLLSLTEERKIIRRGKSYYVPIIVVATANPPGYDPTAKQLSPPLAARISRSFRVSQPSLKTLVRTIIPEKLADINSTCPKEAQISPFHPYVARAAAATLCLWGYPGNKKHPEKSTKGAFYLEESNKELLRNLSGMLYDDKSKNLLKSLNQYIVFGPDARAVTDWLACAIGVYQRKIEKRNNDHNKPDNSRNKTDDDLLRESLVETCIESLAHKVRENFNAGAEPKKLHELENLIRDIVNKLFSVKIEPETNKIICNILGPVPVDAKIHHFWNTNETLDYNNATRVTMLWIALSAIENPNWLALDSKEFKDTFNKNVQNVWFDTTSQKTLIPLIERLKEQRSYFADSIQWSTGHTVIDWLKEKNNPAFSLDKLIEEQSLERLLPLRKDELSDDKLLPEDKKKIYQTLKELIEHILNTTDSDYLRIHANPTS